MTKDEMELAVEDAKAEMMFLALEGGRMKFQQLVDLGEEAGIPLARRATVRLIQEGKLKTKPCLVPDDPQLNDVWPADAA
jgi:hypothetical protein